MRGVLVLGLLLGLLCACDRPRWARHDPGTQPTAADMTPPPKKAPPPNSPQSAPDVEAWAAGFMGKPIRGSFAKDGACLGNLDQLSLRYAGPAPGSKVIGWGWDLAARRGVEQVLLADEAGLVIGAGSGGSPRLDVPPVMPVVTSKTTGWQATTSKVSGRVIAFGLTDGGTAICALGQIEL